MVSVFQISVHNLHKCRILQVSGSQAVKCRGEAGDADGQDDTTWLENAESFPQCLHPIESICQMVQRSEQQDSVHGFVLS